MLAIVLIFIEKKNEVSETDLVDEESSISEMLFLINIRTMDDMKKIAVLMYHGHELL
jgi:hypothetical protein